MAAADHPIILEQVLFTRSIVVALPGHTPTPGTQIPAPENTIDVTQINSQPRTYQVSMRCLLNQEGNAAYPYLIDMECFCIVRADDTLSDEEAHRGATITGHSVVYGAIREAVSWITGRSPYGPLTLGLSVLGAGKT